MFRLDLEMRSMYFFQHFVQGLRTPARLRAFADWLMEASVITGVIPGLDYVLKIERLEIPWATFGLCALISLLCGGIGIYLSREE